MIQQQQHQQQQHNHHHQSSDVTDIEPPSHDASLNYIVLIKRGCHLEVDAMDRAGNRGKRDSQLLILGILNRLNGCRHEYTALDCEFESMLQQCNVRWMHFEYLLMVDADTRLAADAISHLVYRMEHKKNALACCGETLVDTSAVVQTNQTRNQMRCCNLPFSWVTMIQVFEYYTSHNLKKAFESVFGCVTCLPGCFSMFRLYRNRPRHYQYQHHHHHHHHNLYDADSQHHPEHHQELQHRRQQQQRRQRRRPIRQPLLLDDEIFCRYSQRNLQSLHEKNLLELGEDRLLTTLLLSTFPSMQLIFVPESKCWTVVPHTLEVLLSQRRRWINSTIHNMLELLVHKGIGCCMKAIVASDFAMTVLMPASYLFLFIVLLPSIDWTSNEEILAMVAIPILLMVPFIFRSQWIYLGWFLIYAVLGTIVFGCVLPVYAICNMDDLSWGKTRMMVDSNDDDDDVDGHCCNDDDDDDHCCNNTDHNDSEKARCGADDGRNRVRKMTEESTRTFRMIEESTTTELRHECAGSL
mmetsp:Transcript_4886/g.14143  ORF Transcript_4886/g.14143 Transcript_4886/m.14143 type:complete len:524 (+) Transcript_4886:841-2412(+)